MIKAVLDTNVLVSGLISPKGSPAKIIKKYHLSRKTINEFLNGFLIFSEICQPTKKLLVIKIDPQDNKFIEAAVTTRANFIVSGDKHLLGLGEYKGIKILSAKEFLDELKKSKI